jgi:hypothetical protein
VDSASCPELGSTDWFGDFFWLHASSVVVDLQRRSRMDSPFADKNSIKSNLNLVLLADFFHAYQRTS